MRMISHPMRLDSMGAVVTIDDQSARAAAEVGAHVVACRTGERALAPPYGIPDPALHEVTRDDVAVAIATCEPELDLLAIYLRGNGRQRVTVDVGWRTP
jgi:hypothetical protein